MNFLKIKGKYHLVFLFIGWITLLQSAYTQFVDSRFPLETIFSLSPAPQNRIFSVVRDTSGILFLGTLDRVLRYNGSFSPVAYVNGRVILGKNTKGTILAGGSNQLGELRTSGNGQVRFVVYNFPGIAKSGNIKALFPQDQEWVVASDSGLFRLYSSGFSKIISNEDLLSVKSSDDGSVIILKRDSLLYYKRGAFHGIKLNKRLYQPSGQLCLYRNSGTLFVIVEGNQWYSLKGSEFEKTTPPRSDQVRFKEIVSAWPLPGNHYLFKTRKGDLQVGGSTPFPVKFYPESSDVETLQPVFTDTNELFLLSDFSVYRPWFFAPFRYFPYHTLGLDKSINNLGATGNHLLLLTSAGVYSAETGLDRNIPGSSSYLRNLQRISSFDFTNPPAVIMPFYNHFIIVHQRGIFLAGNKTFRRIAEYKNIQASAASIDRKHLFILENGWLKDFRIDAGRSAETLSVKYLSSVNTGIDNATGMVADTAGRIFIRQASGPVFVIRILEDGLFSSADTVDSGGTRCSALVSSSGGIFLFTPGAVRKYHEKTQSFEPDTFFVPYRSFSQCVYPFYTDSHSGYTWMVYHGEAPYLNRILGFHFDNLQESHLLWQSDYNLTAMTEDTVGILWLGGQEGLVSLDTRASVPVNHPGRALFIRIIAGKDTLLEDASGSNSQVAHISSQQNDVFFQFGSTRFGNDKLLVTRYWLQGLMKNYSEWGYEYSKEFVSLPPGRYVFHLQVRFLHSPVVQTASYSFVIYPPLYQRWYAFLFYLFLAVLSVIVFLRWRSWKFMQEKIRLEELVSSRTEELMKEKEKTEDLIAKILPKDTADELKKKGKATSQKYEMVTVLFSDIQGFTKIAEQMNPETLIDQLDVFYLQFDSVVEKYNIEKIKTIGDAYMCAGGIPDKNRTNPVEVVLAGLEMQQYMRDMKAQNTNIWDLRIGIHTGPVIAGVIGQKKFSYDIWGDTVNVASRMESSGEAGKVNISGHTYELVRDFFICEYRGRMPVKYKGEIDMYFVKGIRPELSLNLKGLPNHRFFLQLQNLRLSDLEELVLGKLEKEMPGNLYFHNTAYTVDVYTQTELLGRAEELSDEELLLTRTAGLFQGIGYLLDYHDPLMKSIEFASDVLPRYKYAEGQVHFVLELMRSISKKEPQTLPEKILWDAQMNYIGRTDYIQKTKDHYRELQEHMKEISVTEWIHRETHMVRHYPFYTQTARRLREVDPETQCQLLESTFRKSQ